MMPISVTWSSSANANAELSCYFEMVTHFEKRIVAQSKDARTLKNCLTRGRNAIAKHLFDDGVEVKGRFGNSMRVLNYIVFNEVRL